MVRAWFALLVFCSVFAVVGIMDVAPLHSSAAAQNALTPRDTVANFYRWYLAYAAPDAEGNFTNPLEDRAYRDSAYLAPELVAAMDALLEAGPLMADPFLCAQGIPADFAVTTQANGSYLISGLYPSGPETTTTYPLATVRVAEHLSGWQITDIACAGR